MIYGQTLSRLKSSERCPGAHLMTLSYETTSFLLAEVVRQGGPMEVAGHLSESISLQCSSIFYQSNHSCLKSSWADMSLQQSLHPGTPLQNYYLQIKSDFEYYYCCPLTIALLALADQKLIFYAFLCVQTRVSPHYLMEFLFLIYYCLRMGSQPPAPVIISSENKAQLLFFNRAMAKYLRSR